MSTRKLILLALACGLAILVAGSIQLLRIKDNEARTLRAGDSTEVATLKVTVVSGRADGTRVLVVARLEQSASASAPLADAGAGWSLLRGGLKEPVSGVGVAVDAVPSCAEVTVAPGAAVECGIAFPVEVEDPDTSFVTFRFVGSQATWSLAV